jgi:RNA polymerase sigma-70 factor, ECF subfamily
MNEEAFRAFFTANFGDVWAFVRRRVASDEDADDVTADAFAVAWRRRDQLPAGAERMWLFRTAYNVLANLRRSLARQQRLHSRIAATDPPEVAYAAVAEVDHRLWSALAALSRGDRELLLMRAWDDLEVADIAAILQVSAATVSSRLYKARDRLHRELGRRDRPVGGNVPGGSHGKGGGRR